MADPDIQKEVLALREQHKTSEDLIAFIEDRETGRRSQTSLSAPANISRISQYRQNKNKSGGSATNVSNSEIDICSYCGERGHGSKSPRSVRQQRCPAFSKSCENCSKVGHITKMCRLKNKNPKDITPISYHTDFIGSIQIASLVKCFFRKSQKGKLMITVCDCVDKWFSLSPSSPQLRIKKSEKKNKHQY